MEITEPNSPDLGNMFDSFAGMCGNSLVAGARVSLSGNCLTLSPDANCVSNATQRSVAACHAFCSITDNGPCDSHGACVPSAPTSTSNFTCQCDAGYSAIDAGNGSTCATESNTTSPNSSESSSPAAASGGGGVSVGVIIGIAVAAVVVLLLLVAVLLYFRHKKQQKPKGVTTTSLAASHCTEFSLAEVLKATNSWSNENQLGSGAFGDVYKGVSPRDGTTVWAVKRARWMNADFQKEVQNMADKNHPNIVRLLGFAIGGDMQTRPEQALIYEFVSNGDLQKWMDPSHMAKVADFGLVRVEEGTTVGTTRIMGTPGYVDPVYTKTSKANTTSDVYSFGVLMLVVLTRRPALLYSDGGGRTLLSWVEECLTSGTTAKLKDSDMDAPDDAVVRVAQLAVSCTVERTASRPNMAHIANHLQAIREEVAGKDKLSAAIKVDAQVQKMKDASTGVGSLEAELQLIRESYAKNPV
ncbi:hypothetical protein CLOM_g14184 [Closterium sp. NIES-68]|nr:hypothetical protein CLOM_g14184 [Closterium sp. NIES-68]GJP60338.1 hypothetical protein CLOP_g17542 [Closterium sp. NIES-67]